MIGQTIDRYTLVEKLGAGGMGDVYKGHHISLDQYRAIKILPPYLSQNPELVERFLREARRCAALQHPNIVRLEHVGEQDGIYFMVMDYVPGGNLRHLIDDQGPLPAERAVDLARQGCRALAHAHEAGVIHRDVKPSNILVGQDGRVVLTDFGIARGLEGDEPGLTVAGATVGTPEYMSPEQIRGDAADGRSDLYSLGVVLYEMVTGELPFAARSKATVKRLHLEKRPESPRFHNAEVPRALEAVILKALRKNPAERFSSAAGMAEALERALREPDVVPEEIAVERGPREPATVISTTSLSWPVERPAGTLLGAAAGPELRRDAAGYGHDSPTVVTANGRAPEKKAPDLPFTAWLPWPLPFKVDVRRLPGTVLGAGALAVVLLAFSVLQVLGGSGGGRRFTAEKGTDPRTGKEFGTVRAHGVPVFVVTEAAGELSPAQRAEKAAERLQEMVAAKDDEALDPESLVAVVNGRGETVLARREKGAPEDRDPRPEDVIVTVDSGAAKTYVGEDRSAVALWWRDLLRDHVRLARGVPPVSTFSTRPGRILDRVYQEVEDEKRSGWIPAEEIQKAFDALPETHETVLETAWRTVPAEWGGSSPGGTAAAGLIELPVKTATASDVESGFPAAHAIDGNARTAWQSRHGLKYRGERHWIKLALASPATISELHIREGQRSKPQYQLRIKQAKVTFSDGYVKRVWRAKATDPLKLTVPARRAQWAKIEVEQTFNNRRPHDSHLYVAEVSLWGQ